ncbi:MAG: hypothetical protein ACL7BU_01355 [Candidatus Phlomobacter fragariae]
MNHGDVHAQKGVIQFSDVIVNESTGSITMRTIFPNLEKTTSWYVCSCCFRRRRGKMQS